MNDAVLYEDELLQARAFEPQNTLELKVELQLALNFSVADWCESRVQWA